MSTIRPPKSWKSVQRHYKEALLSPWYKIITGLQSEFVKATVAFYNTKKYDFVLLPITTGSVSSPMGLGSDSSPVKVNIAGVDTYLADSMQFFLEYSCRLRDNGCYYLAPSFRGEKSDSRHLCQFYHSEAEINGDLNDTILLVEDYLRFLCSWFITNCKTDLLSVAGSVEHIENFIKLTKVPRIMLNEAALLLKNNKMYIEDNEKFRTITSEGEKKLIEHFGGFVWLTHFDYLSVPFYQKSYDDTNTVAINADLLMGIGETVGAGERHFDRSNTEKALRYHNVDKKNYEWYLDMKEVVVMQTSGFGMGVERFLLWLTQQNDIRDMQLVPRFNGEVSIL